MRYEKFDSLKVFIVVSRPSDKEYQDNLIFFAHFPKNI